MVEGKKRGQGDVNWPLEEQTGNGEDEEKAVVASGTAEELGRGENRMKYIM